MDTSKCIVIGSGIGMAAIHAALAAAQHEGIVIVLERIDVDQLPMDRGEAFPIVPIPVLSEPIYSLRGERIGRSWTRRCTSNKKR